MSLLIQYLVWDGRQREERGYEYSALIKRHIQYAATQFDSFKTLEEQYFYTDSQWYAHLKPIIDFAWNIYWFCGNWMRSKWGESFSHQDHRPFPPVFCTTLVIVVAKWIFTLSPPTGFFWVRCLWHLVLHKATRVWKCAVTLHVTLM